MNKIDKVKDIVNSFETALNNAGMQDRYGTNTTKHYYFRGKIDQGRENDLLLMRYQVTDVIANNADNDYHTVAVYINATMFINSDDGFFNSSYQTLISTIETECAKQGWSMSYGVESAEDIIGDASTITHSIQIEFRKIR